MFNTLIEWFRVRAAAKIVGLRDKGEVTAMVWSEDEEGKVPGFLTHIYCGTHVRIGIVTSPEKRSVWWCHCCELIFPDDDEDESDDRGGSSSPRSPEGPSPEGEEFTADSQQEATKVIQRFATRAIPP